MKTKPVCQSLNKWLRINRGQTCLGVLSGTDYKALETVVHLVALYCYDGDPSLLEAFAIVVNRMQPAARPLAYHAIAHLMDWPDRERIWAAAGLPRMFTGRCIREPDYGAPSSTTE
jgi:hypothetical protein